MRTDQPPTALRRLSGRPEETDEGDGPEAEPDDGDPPPSWLPDGRADPGGRLLSAIRADPGRAGGAALAAVAVIAVLVTVFTVMREDHPPVASAKLPPVEMASSAAPRTGSTPAPDQPVVVSVVGLVQQPGLVTLAPGARIADAVTAAGGPLDGADTLGLNLARRVGDGEQIVVGIATPAGHPSALSSAVTPGSAAADGTPTSAAPAPANLNTATAGELDALPGVGPVTAAAIVAWREAHGKFTSVDQLGEVEGIGPARLEKLRTLVRV